MRDGASQNSVNTPGFASLADDDNDEPDDEDPDADDWNFFTNSENAFLYSAGPAGCACGDSGSGVVVNGHSLGRKQLPQMNMVVYSLEGHERFPMK